MNFIQQLPKGVLVFLVLLGGLILIMIAQPPHSVCEPQLEIFKGNQVGFLYPDPKKTYVKTSGFRKALDFCKQGNNAGSCHEFVDGLRKMIEVALSAPKDCLPEISELGEVSGATWQGLELLVRAAWGSAAPRSALERQGWLDSSDMAVFCDLKKFAISNYGQSQWTAFVDSKLQQLPGSSLMSRPDAWQRTIMSDQCR
jgi:hypothetical protein